MKVSYCNSPKMPLHIIYIIGCSNSMLVDGKIQSLNNAIREFIPHLQQFQDDHPNAEVLVRVIKFSNGAQWHIADPTPIRKLIWIYLDALGRKHDMGEALSMVADQLNNLPMTKYAFRPTLVLISDNSPTDDFEAGLKAIMEQPGGKKTTRIAIAIGKDADQGVLQKFIGNPELEPIQANNLEALINYIGWTGTPPLSQAKNSESSVVNVPIQTPGDDVW